MIAANYEWPASDLAAHAIRGEHRAWQDARKAIARDIPDPDEFAFQLTLRECDALTTAFVGRQGWRVADEYVAELGSVGLVECGGPCLSAFGLAVRRALRRERA